MCTCILPLWRPALSQFLRVRTGPDRTRFHQPDRNIDTLIRKQCGTEKQRLDRLLPYSSHLYKRNFSNPMVQILDSTSFCCGLVWSIVGNPDTRSGSSVCSTLCMSLFVTMSLDLSSSGDFLVFASKWSGSSQSVSQGHHDCEDQFCMYEHNTALDMEYGRNSTFIITRNFRYLIIKSMIENLYYSNGIHTPWNIHMKLGIIYHLAYFVSFFISPFFFLS